MNDNRVGDPNDNHRASITDKPALSLVTDGQTPTQPASTQAVGIADIPVVIRADIPSIDRRELDPELRADIAGAYSLNTMRAYKADFADWCAWCARTGRSKPVPAEPRALRDYLVDLAQGKKLSTLRRRVAAIAKAHALAGYRLDTQAPEIYHALRRLAREKGAAKIGRAELMTADILAMVRQCPQDLRGLRDRAILLLGFAAGMRRSEIVAIQVNDVAWKREGVVIQIRRSKTDQEGEGQAVAIAHGKREASCPVRALRRWLDKSGIAAGSVFRPVEGGQVGQGALSDQMVYAAVKKYAARAGLDPTQLGAHSLRVGHVTQALANDAEPTKVQQTVRHRRLDTTMGYNRGRSFKDSSSGKLGL